MSEMSGKVSVLCLCFCVSLAEAHIWAWMLNMPHRPPKDGSGSLGEHPPVARAATVRCYWILPHNCDASGKRKDNRNELTSTLHGVTDGLHRFNIRPFSVQAVCDHKRACGRGFSCDRHFGLCVPQRGEGHYCRRDAQCVRGLRCMFGKCHRSIPSGQEGKNPQPDGGFLTFGERAPIGSVLRPGARCKVDRDCESSMCCARHHGERVCKRRLVRGASCYIPDGGLAFSINQICPCDEGLLCREDSAPRRRE